MKEARFILPLADNSGLPLDLLHVDLERELCRRFGGATITASAGIWADNNGRVYREPGRCYDVAMADDGSPQANVLAKLFAGIAAAYGRRAGQLAVYLRHASGQVEILDLKTARAAA